VPGGYDYLPGFLLTIFKGAIMQHNFSDYESSDTLTRHSVLTPAKKKVGIDKAKQHEALNRVVEKALEEYCFEALESRELEPMPELDSDANALIERGVRNQGVVLVAGL
jgi:hypothetical protein